MIVNWYSFVLSGVGSISDLTNKKRSIDKGKVAFRACVVRSCAGDGSDTISCRCNWIGRY